MGFWLPGSLLAAAEEIKADTMCENAFENSPTFHRCKVLLSLIITTTIIIIIGTIVRLFCNQNETKILVNITSKAQTLLL